MASNVNERTYYRGTNLGDTRRISTGDSYWDSKLFLADNPAHARNYGDHIEEYRFQPNARILAEGTAEFRRLAGRTQKNENLLAFCSRVLRSAEAAGYDAVYFHLQGTIGTVVIHRTAIQKLSAKLLRR